MNSKKTVLDKGYVRLVDSMGSDLTVINSAKLSKARKSGGVTEQGGKLIKNLAEWHHWTPFSHVMVQLEIKMPIFIARQYFKSTVGFSRNEESRRSITDDPEFYVPAILKTKGQENTDFLIDDMIMHYEKDLKFYNKLLKNKVAPEQARIVLPQAMYTTFIETGSLAAYARLYKLRIKKDAQWEIQEYAKAIDKACLEVAPISWAALKRTV